MCGASRLLSPVYVETCHELPSLGVYPCRLPHILNKQLTCRSILNNISRVLVYAFFLRCGFLIPETLYFDIVCK